MIRMCASLCFVLCCSVDLMFGCRDELLFLLVCLFVRVVVYCVACLLSCCLVGFVF